MTRSRPADVETLACAVAGEYAGRWARSVARTQPRAEGDAVPWLVDGFAGADLQRAALRGATVSLSAAAFVRAAEQALGGDARIVLVEEDPGLLSRVEDELRGAGTGGRLRRTSDVAGVEPGEIALVEASLASVVDRLADAIGDGQALVRLAPLAARAVPWIVLEPLAMLSSADLLIRIPQEDFVRIGRCSGPLADFPPHLRRVAESCSAMFADPRHAWLLAWREAARAGGEEAALAGAVDRLRTMLGDAGEERIVRAARLDAAGAAVHLLLSTAHAGHALELNGAITDCGATPPASTLASRRAKSPKPSAAPAAEARPAAGQPSEASLAEGPPADAVPSASPPDAPPSAAPAAPTDSPSAEPPAPDASTSAHSQPGPPAPAPAAREPSAPEEPASLLDLFALSAAPEPAPRGPDLRAIADDLHAQHVGQRVPFRELLTGLADTGLAPEQVRTVLGMLKRAGRAAFRSLDAEGAEVEFRAETPAPPPAPAPKPRKTRKPAPDLLGLFDEPADEAQPADEPEPADDPEPADEAPPADATSWMDEPMSLADAIFPDEDVDESTSAPPAPPDPPEPPAADADAPAPAKARRRKKGE